MNVDVSHHAHLCTGPREARVAELYKTIAAHWQIATEGNPDVQYLSFERFGIADARELRSRASERALQSAGSFFIVAFDFITAEAQNALLKLFEDPPEDTRFFLVVRSADVLLPTLRSRLAAYRAAEAAGVEEADGAAFARAGKAERFKQIQEIAGEKDKAGAIALLDSLEHFLYPRFKKEPARGEMADALNAIQTARAYLSDTGASVKMLLEYVATVLPTIR